MPPYNFLLDLHGMKSYTTKKKNHPSIIFSKSIEEFEVALKKLAKNRSSIFILTDENTVKHCFPVIKDLLNNTTKNCLITIRSREEYKSMQTAEAIYQRLMQSGADRKSLLINLGGGIVTDMGGFVASTFKRGIDFIHIPTSLLAMVDASIGGKTAINIKGIKNQVGTFSQPNAILISSEFLKTLPQKEILSGFAEMIKHGLIAEADHWNELKRLKVDDRDIDWLKMIKTSVKIKQKIIQKDPYDLSERKLLNFGHTIGHAIEAFKKGSVSHGKAIAAGMICAAYISLLNKMLEQKAVNEITETILSFFPKLKIDRTNFHDILEFIQHDKKSEDKKQKFVLLNKIGKATFDHYIPDSQIIQSLEYYIHY